MIYILWFLFVYGGSYVTSQSEIGKEFRQLFEFKKYNYIKRKINYLSKCIICSGFWWAIIATFLFSPSAIFILPFYLQFIINGIIGISANKLIYTLIERMPNIFE